MPLDETAPDMQQEENAGPSDFDYDAMAAHAAARSARESPVGLEIELTVEDNQFKHVTELLTDRVRRPSQTARDAMNRYVRKRQLDIKGAHRATAAKHIKRSISRDGKTAD